MTLTEECRLVKGIRAVSNDHPVDHRVVRAEDLVGGMSESQLDGGVLLSVDAVFVLRMFSRMDGCPVSYNQAVSREWPNVGVPSLPKEASWIFRASASDVNIRYLVHSQFDHYQHSQPGTHRYS
jgi:hypothetical protein